MKSRASDIISDLELAEKKQLADDIRNGLLVDRKRLATKLLVQEIDFFMAKKKEVEDKLKAAEIQRDNLAADQKNSGTVGALTADIHGLTLSRNFFDRQISVAVYELKSRNNKRDLRCMLLKPVSLTTDGWQSLLKDEGLEDLRSPKLTAN